MHACTRSLLVVALAVGCTTPDRPSPEPEVAWLRGQLHAHTARSADSRTAPSDVADWYAAHGFDFVVFTDHDHVTTLEPRDDILVVPGVELTQNDRDCDPPPAPGELCLLHVNALFVDPQHAGPVHVPPSDRSRLARFRTAIDQAHALGGLAQLNHPNFHHAVDAAQLAALGERGEGADLFELANEAVDSDNQGDAIHPSVEALWDAALSRRGAGMAYATATDDAHHYADAAAVRAAGEVAHVGDRGWVVVRAARSAEAIQSAVDAGDFYASNGVALDDVKRHAGTLHVRVSADTPAAIHFIGASGTLAVAAGPVASYRVESGYVRAVIRDRQGRTAWTQPSFAP